MTIFDKINMVQKSFNEHDGSLQKIVNGELAFEEEYPYAVALTDINGFLFCGGTLITPSVVLTAAHCFQSNIVESALLGCNDLASGLCETHVVGQIILHPEFDFLGDNEVQANDIAILVLIEPSFQEVAQIPSPLVGQDTFNDFPSFEIGWGNTVPASGQFEGGDVLREADTVIISNSVCAQQIEPLFELTTLNTETVDETMICSLTNSKGGCQGDDGGPLLIQCNGNNNDLIVGVKSFSVGCAYDGHPNGFARTFNQAAFDFIIDEVSKVGQLAELSVLNDLEDFCVDNPVTISPIAPTPYPTANLGNWTCLGIFYANQDGCDCQCGIPDPDCQFDQDLFFCGFSICSPEEECRDTPTPTSNPTDEPTSAPSKTPTGTPTKNPSKVPSSSPTQNPSKTPSKVPTNNPTKNPTDAPLTLPTSSPTARNNALGTTLGITLEQQIMGLGVLILIILCLCLTMGACFSYFRRDKQIHSKKTISGITNKNLQP